MRIMYFERLCGFKRKINSSKSKSGFWLSSPGRLNGFFTLRTAVLPGDDRLTDDLVCPEVFRVDHLVAFHLGVARLYGAPQ